MYRRRNRIPPRIFDFAAKCSEVWLRTNRSEGGGRSRFVTAERSEAGARRGEVCLGKWSDAGFLVPRSKSGAFQIPSTQSNERLRLRLSLPLGASQWLRLGTTRGALLAGRIVTEQVRRHRLPRSTGLVIPQRGGHVLVSCELHDLPQRHLLLARLGDEP